MNCDSFDRQMCGTLLGARGTPSLRLFADACMLDAYARHGASDDITWLVRKARVSVATMTFW
jgi:hypothetical protein